MKDAPPERLAAAAEHRVADLVQADLVLAVPEVVARRGAVALLRQWRSAAPAVGLLGAVVRVVPAAVLAERADEAEPAVAAAALLSIPPMA